MVKAGVYIIKRLAPYLKDCIGILIALVRSSCCNSNSLARCCQESGIFDHCKSWAIVACCGVNGRSTLGCNTADNLHAIAKSLLFLSVGTVEHQIHSRDIEDTTGFYQDAQDHHDNLIGIAGMFLHRSGC